ncbi:biopolymer transporter ExbD [Victivallis sp. Marseille-Q1083]|uniref:ExbD/TolR family protein n=1 Tax=Victivallis sp. Marseille-Q1083 TaxID=2717288 RepID=UPI00158B9860|nr:biopolymer transporter ExbD [Victivallis sp. Marseille-Q1083]
MRRRIYHCSTSRLRSRLHAFQGRPDLTPVVDVMFLLLIFFMLSSSFVQVSGIAVDLPPVGATGSVGLEKFSITVAYTENGTEIYFNDRPVSWEKLPEELGMVRTVSNMNTVIIRADKQVPFGTIAKIMAMAERANLSTFIATMPPQDRGETIFNPNER